MCCITTHLNSYHNKTLDNEAVLTPQRRQNATDKTSGQPILNVRYPFLQVARVVTIQVRLSA